MDNTTALAEVPQSANVSLPQSGTPPSTSMSIFSLYFLQLRILCTALMVIYCAAYGAIQRPHTAAPAPHKSREKGDNYQHQAVDEEEVPESKTHLYAEALTAQHIILLPVTAGIVLGSLYLLITWLQDPAMLNAILNVWLSVSGLVTATMFYSDSMAVIASVVFPSMWTDRVKNIFVIPRSKHQVYQLCRRPEVVVAGDGAQEDQEKVTRGTANQGNNTNTAGQQKRQGILCWGRLPDGTPPVPYWIPEGPLRKMIGSIVWCALDSFHEKWSLVVNIPGVTSEPAVFSFTLAHLASVGIAMFLSAVTCFAKNPLTSNITGVAFSYGSIMLMSPYSFPVGSSVLGALLVYDIVMVFYTPFMITVATKLDVPIKLSFQQSGNISILGLGDIILPGILIAMCLRFDLWRHYRSKITRQYIITLANGDDDDDDDDVLTNANGSALLDKFAVKTITIKLVKAPYISPSGHWGDRIWLRNYTRRYDAQTGLQLLPLRNTSPATATASASPTVTTANFPVSYFHSALLGYTLGMVLTLVAVQLSHHGQPALLYLVPCVIGSVWLTGAMRGELQLLWTYTEDQEELVCAGGDGEIENAGFIEANGRVWVGPRMEESFVVDTPASTIETSLGDTTTTEEEEEEEEEKGEDKTDYTKKEDGSKGFHHDRYSNDNVDQSQVLSILASEGIKGVDATASLAKSTTKGKSDLEKDKLSLFLQARNRQDESYDSMLCGVPIEGSQSQLTVADERQARHQYKPEESVAFTLMLIKPKRLWR